MCTRMQACMHAGRHVHAYACMYACMHARSVCLSTTCTSQDAIARSGGVQQLVALLDPDNPKADADVQAHAAFALMEISRSNVCMHA